MLWKGVMAAIVLFASVAFVSSSGVSCSGFVRDQLGEAIPGIEVSTVSGTVVSVFTAPNGKYSMTGIDRGVRVRVAVPEGYSIIGNAESQELDLDSNTADFTLYDHSLGKQD